VSQYSGATGSKYTNRICTLQPYRHTPCEDSTKRNDGSIRDEGFSDAFQEREQLGVCDGLWSIYGFLSISGFLSRILRFLQDTIGKAERLPSKACVNTSSTL
jgi:hypothetical protein